MKAAGVGGGGVGGGDGGECEEEEGGEEEEQANGDCGLGFVEEEVGGIVALDW